MCWFGNCAAKPADNLMLLHRHDRAVQHRGDALSQGLAVADIGLRMTEPVAALERV